MRLTAPCSHFPSLSSAILHQSSPESPSHASRSSASHPGLGSRSKGRSWAGSAPAGWCSWAWRRGDADEDADRLAEKVVDLRAFEDDAGQDEPQRRGSGGSVLVVSQFTLLGDCRGGRRPASSRRPSRPRPNGSIAASTTPSARPECGRHRCVPGPYERRAGQRRAGDVPAR